MPRPRRRTMDRRRRVPHLPPSETTARTHGASMGPTHIVRIIVPPAALVITSIRTFPSTGNLPPSLLATSTLETQVLGMPVPIQEHAKPSMLALPWAEPIQRLREGQ